MLLDQMSDDLRVGLRLYLVPFGDQLLLQRQEVLDDPVVDDDDVPVAVAVGVLPVAVAVRVAVAVLVSVRVKVRTMEVLVR